MVRVEGAHRKAPLQHWIDIGQRNRDVPDGGYNVARTLGPGRLLRVGGTRHEKERNGPEDATKLHSHSQSIACLM